MPKTVQEFVARATEKVGKDLETLALKIPAEKRYWRADGKGRSAADQLAECALMNLNAVELLETHKWPLADWDEWGRLKNDLAEDWDTLLSALAANTAKLAAAIRAVPDTDLDIDIVLPWETANMAEVLNYCYWNMSYHEGQITFISLLLE
jgi:molybdopterin converting factor small subunit